MNCINDSDPLVKDLLFVSPYDARTTKALISIWQDEHGFNDFPTIADLMDIVYGDVLVEPQGYTGFLEDNFIANNFGYVSNKAILKAALDNCVKYNGSPYKFHLQMLRCLKSADSRKENWIASLASILTPETVDNFYDYSGGTVSSKYTAGQLADFYADWHADKSSVPDYLRTLFERMAVIEEVLENNAMAFLAYSNGLTKKNYVDYVRDNEIYSSRDNFSRIIVDKEKLTNDDKEKIRARFINTLYRNGVGRNTNVEITDPELVNGQWVVHANIAKPDPSNYGLSDAVVKSENSKVLSQKQISVLKSQIFGTNEDGSPKTQLNAKEVLKRLKTRLGTNDPILDRVIELMDDETMCYMSDFTAIRKSGSYNGDDNIIELYFGLFDANHNNNRTMIHEAIHAITSRFIDNNPDHQLVKELSDLISVAKDKIKNTDDTEIAYYLSKPKEFIAGFFSDERFRDLLMQVEYSKSKSIFDRIVEWLSKVFGIGKRSSYFKVLNKSMNDVLTAGSRFNDLKLENLKTSVDAMIDADESAGSRYSRAINSLSQKFDIKDINEIQQSIVDAFSDIIDKECSTRPEKSRHDVIREVTPQSMFSATEQRFKNFYDFCVSKNAKASVISKLAMVLENFNDFCVIASTDINKSEGLSFNLDSLKVSKRNDTPSQIEDGEDVIEEEAIKEGWMTDFRTISIDDSITQLVRRRLRNIKQVDSNGKKQFNSIGLPKKMRFDIVKIKLMRALGKMESSDDFMPLLREMATKDAWVNDVIAAVEADPEFYTQMHNAFNKDATNFRVIKTYKKDNNIITYKTIGNLVSSNNAFLEEWKNNIINGIVVDAEKSIYNEFGEINATNAAINKARATALLAKWDRAVSEGVPSIQDFINKHSLEFKSLMSFVGVNLTVDDVKLVLSDYTENKNSASYNGHLMLSTLSNMFANAMSGKSVKTAEKLWEDNNNNYKYFARTLSAVYEEFTEDSMNVNAKTFYSHTYPSFLSKFIKKMKNTSGIAANFEKFVQESFRQYVGTIYNENTGEYNIPWLNELLNSEEARNMFNHSVTIAMNDVEGEKISDTDYLTTLLVNYFSNEGSALYHVPVLGDASSMEFIKYYKDTSLEYKDNILDKMFDIFLYEIGRMRLIRERKRMGIAPGDTRYIDNIDSIGDSFVIFPSFNSQKGFFELADAMILQGKTNELKNLFVESQRAVMDNGAAAFREYMGDLGLLQKTESGKYTRLNSIGITEMGLNNATDNYFYNSYFATMNIILMTSSDMAFFKSVEDFQKRNKELHAPGTAPNTSATYNGVRVGKDIERSIVIEDEVSPISEATRANIESILDRSNLTAAEKKNIMKSYSENTVTDGQGFRTLKGFKTVISMFTGWNDQLESSYQRLLNGKWSMDDYHTIFQALKPYVYTMTPIDTGVKLNGNDPQSPNVILKVPYQRKCSESLLLAVFAEQMQSPKIKGLIKTMNDDDLGIDVAIFHSAIKVGATGVINLDGLKEENDIYKHIKQYKGNKQVIRETPFSDYKVQLNVPEHIFDAYQMFGTQLRRHIMSDFTDSNTTLSIGSSSVSASQQDLLKLYDALISEDIIDEYRKLQDDFSTPDMIKRVLEEEIINNDRNSKDLLNALQIVDGKFVLPLYEPVQSMKVQQMINAIWKKRIINQKMKGGSLVHMSGYGLSNHLDIKFRTDSNGKVAMNYMECYVPFPSDIIPENLEGFIDAKTGVMDVNKMLEAGVIEQNFLDLIAYRIPTEAKYSVWPLKIKGFLPRNMGTNIILPDAITTIAGLDFDIDKCYVMAQEFTFNKEKGQFIVTKPPSRKDINAEPKEGEMNILGLADPQYMSKAERHNLLFSVMRATLRNSEVSETQFTPGNFDELKKTGKIVEALNNPDVNLSYDELSKLSISDLRRLNDNKSDIFSPKSQVQLFRRNNVAAGLIGIVALNEVNNIYRQSTEAKLAKPITINNRSLSKLNNVKINGRYLSSVFSQYAAATVDAVKDPILDSMNMNMNTINAAMLLTSLGFTIEETGLFMSQPAIVELSRIFTLNPYTNAGVELKKMLKEKTNQMASLEHEGSDTRPDEELTVRNLAYRISDSAKGMSNVPFDIAVIKTAIQLFDDAKEMSDFVGASRADSSNTKIGPSIADTSALELKILTHNVNQEKTNTKGEPVSKIRNLPKISLDTSYLKDHAALRKEFRENGFIQAFTTCGIAGNVNMMDSMFPHHRYFGILSEIQSNVSKNGRLTVKQVNSIFNDIFVFEMSQYDRFSHTKHQAYNKEFPVQFALFKEKYKEQLKDIKFIQNIKFYPGTPTNYPYLKFVTRGKVNSETRESFIREWESLIYSTNEEIRQKARQLFMYSYFNNGFSYSSSGFSQYAPVAVKTAVKGYVDALRSLIERDKNDASSFPSNNFIEQYVLNHPDIIPEINMEDFPKAEISDVSITIPVGEDETIDSLASPHGGWLRYVTIITEDNGVETQRIYRNVTEKDDDHVTLEYVVPLGSNNDAIEYDYHFNRDNIIRRSDILKAPVVADIQRVNERIEEAPVESNDWGKVDPSSVVTETVDVDLGLGDNNADNDTNDTKKNDNSSPNNNYGPDLAEYRDMENQIAEGAIYDIIDSSNYANDYDEKKTKEYETDLREIYDFVYNFFGNNYHRGDQLLVSEDLLKLVTDYFKNKTTKVGMKLKNVSQIYSNSDKYDEDAMHNVNDIIKVIDSAYHRAIDNRNTNWHMYQEYFGYSYSGNDEKWFRIAYDRIYSDLTHKFINNYANFIRHDEYINFNSDGSYHINDEYLNRDYYNYMDFIDSLHIQYNFVDWISGKSDLFKRRFVDNVVKKAVNDWYSDRAGEYNKPIAEPGRLFDVINKYDTYNWNIDNAVIDNRASDSYKKWASENREIFKNYYISEMQDDVWKLYKNAYSAEVVNNANIRESVSSEEMLEVMRDLMSKIKYNRPSNTDVAGFGNKIILDAHNNFREDQEKIDKENKSFSISNNEEQLTKKEEEAINIIKSAIEEQLRNMGVGVGALTEYETAAGIEGNYINGVFDPNAKRKTADGLLELIRIAKGIAGNKALPEEFAHLVDAILKATGSPIYDRLNNAITDERMIAAILEADEEGSFEKYFKAYNGDMELMRTEARGKLIKRHILQQNGIGVTPWAGITNKFLNLFVDTFSKGDDIKLSNDLLAADEIFSKFTVDLMSGKIDLTVDFAKLENRQLLYDIGKALEKGQSAIKKIIDTEDKKLKYDEAKKGAGRLSYAAIEDRKRVIKKMMGDEESGEIVDALFSYMFNSYVQAEQKVEQIMNMDRAEEKMSINNYCGILLDMKNFIGTNREIFWSVLDYLNELKKDNPNALEEGLLKQLNEIVMKFSLLINNFESEYKNNSRKLFTEFIRDYSTSLMGQKIKIGNEVITFEEGTLDNLLLEAEHDISVLDRWLMAMSESGDLLLRLFEQPVKESKFKAREQAQESARQLIRAQEILEEAGHKNTEFMFERDSDGKITGNFMRDRNYRQFYADKAAYQDELDEEYGPMSPGKKDMMKKWLDARADHNGTQWVPKHEFYANPQYDSMDSAQRAYYNTVISMKEKLDRKLPSFGNRWMSPQVRKDFLERIRSGKTLKDKARIFANGIHDMFYETNYEDEFGNIHKLTNPDGTPVESLPVYYRNKLDDMSFLSLDVTSSMIMYADMAHNYGEMSNIIDALEVGVDVMSERRIKQTQNGKPMVNRVEHLGRTIVDSVIKRKGDSRFIERLNSYMSMQVYGHNSLNEGTIFGLSTTKTLGVIGGYTALSTYALNLFSGVSNVITGRINARIDAVSKEFFDIGDLASADMWYGSHIAGTLSEIGKRRKTNKLDLLLEKYNVLQDHETAMRKVEANRKNWLSRAFKMNSLFFLNNCGEHYLQTRTFLAIANRIKLKLNGKDIKLLDAYDVVKDSNGISRLELKEGVTKQDGTAFTSRDVMMLSRKSSRINQKMFGIYNMDDANALQQYAVGRLVIMYRKWITPSMNRRFGGRNFSFETQMMDEGYYRTAGSFLWQVAKDLKDHKLQMAMRWGELDAHQKANMRRMLTEVASFLAVLAAYSLLNGYWDDDDEWTKQFILYELRRTQTELGVLIPSKNMFHEAWKIAQSPAASVNTIGNMLRLFNLGDIWADPVQSGYYKGWNRYSRNVAKAIPVYGQIVRTMDPDSGRKFYENTK